MIEKLNSTNQNEFLLILLCLASCNYFPSKEKIYKEEITYYDNGNVKSKKWVKNDGVYEGPNIKYYPNGNVEAMGIVKNGVINGRIVIYDSLGALTSLVEMKETKIKNGFKYSFYPNHKFESVAYYFNDELRYLKQFDEGGNILYQEGYIPVVFSKVGSTRLNLLNNKTYLRRNIQEKVFITKISCAYDAMHVFITDGIIKPTGILGYYTVFTNTQKNKVIISVRVYNKEHDGLEESFGILVK